jgi:hypothetical protein
MDDISLKQMLKELKGQSLSTKVYGMRLLVMDYFTKWLPGIALGLWVIAGYLFHEIGLYNPNQTDIPTLIGIIAAVTGLVIAESQLTSWKQEKLLERLEQILLAMSAIKSDCNALDQNNPKNPDESIKRKDFVDDDINFGASLISCNWINVTAIEENVQKINHQVLFVKKLINRHSFRINKPKEIIKFLDDTIIYLNYLTILTKTFEKIVQHERDEINYHPQLGYHAHLLTQYYGKWIEFNADRKGKLSGPLEDMVPPNFIIYLKIHALIKTLRI